MIIDEIKEDAKKGEVLVFFDMDGTIAEYDVIEKSPMEDDFYVNKRPLFSMISKAKKLSKMKNVKVGICSICHTAVQKKSKIEWLKKNVPFVDEKLVHIIALDESEYEPETGRRLKGELLTSVYGDKTMYLVEDDLGIIKSTKTHFPNIKITHVSRFFD